MAQEVWDLYEKRDEVLDFKATNVAKPFDYFVKEWNENDAAQFVTIYWVIWNNRNLVVFSEKSTLLTQTIDLAMPSSERHWEARQLYGKKTT